MGWGGESIQWEDWLLSLSLSPYRSCQSSFTLEVCTLHTSTCHAMPAQLPTPDSRLQTPDSRLQTPNSRLQTLDSTDAAAAADDKKK
ncbi:hypothetical protein GJ744_006900 [Endocarpon pusillum]|uniref:Uncharacterized protein n=1 Tax=Endocarpon pusillum TaxID=364733 RepID=A0A8H7E4H8_9EURO|nr:hypothetical protein GJ744_006900 [Endocarpon pusillum]